MLRAIDCTIVLGTCIALIHVMKKNILILMVVSLTHLNPVHAGVPPEAAVAMIPMLSVLPISIPVNRFMEQRLGQYEAGMVRIVDIATAIPAVIAAGFVANGGYLKLSKVLTALAAVKVGGALIDLSLPDSVHAKGLGEHYQKHPEQFNVMSDTSKATFACDSDAPKDLREGHERAVAVSSSSATAK